MNPIRPNSRTPKANITASQSRHPDDEQILAHLNEDLPAQHSIELQTHLDRCESCQRRITDLAAGTGWWQSASEGLENNPSETITPPKQSAESIETAKLDAANWRVESDQVQRLLAPTDDPNKLGRLGGYEVVGIVGAGATAVVLKALDLSLNRFVAIKLLRPTLAASPIARERFAREARAAASIVHENVIEIYGVSAIDSLPYLVMPYVRGESLAKRIERSWPMSTEAMLNIACQIADGLAAAHDKGLVHRDVKPSNVMLGDGVERLKLTDFGLARAIDDVGLTRSGMLAGTPEYMSPEQAGGKPIDHRSDLFSLGSVLYSMCTGRPPFRGESCYGVLRAIIEDTPNSIQSYHSGVPGWLSLFVQRLINKDVEARYQSASDVAADLRKCLNHLHDPSKPLPAELHPRPNRLWVPMAVAGIACAAITVGFALKPTINSPTPSPIGESTDDTEAPLPTITWDDGVDVLLQGLQEDLDDFDQTHP